MSTADIDRLAKVSGEALDASYRNPTEPAGESWSLEYGYYDLHAVVRAVLQALREPGAETIREGVWGLDRYGIGQWINGIWFIEDRDQSVAVVDGITDLDAAADQAERMNALLVWQDMIDKLLEE